MKVMKWVTFVLMVFLVFLLVPACNDDDDPVVDICDRPDLQEICCDPMKIDMDIYVQCCGELKCPDDEDEDDESPKGPDFARGLNWIVTSRSVNVVMGI